MATDGPICMIEYTKWIVRTLVNTFPLQIILIGPFFKEICAENAKWRTKGTPRRERVNVQKYWPIATAIIYYVCS
jgi:hypothetical protein